MYTRKPLLASSLSSAGASPSESASPAGVASADGPATSAAELEAPPVIPPDGPASVSWLAAAGVDGKPVAPSDCSHSEGEDEHYAVRL